MRPFQILQTCLQNCQVRHREVELAEVGKIPLAVSVPVFVRQFLGERLYQFLAVLGAFLPVLLFFHNTPANIPVRGNHGGVHGSVCRILARVNDLFDVIDYLREVFSYGIIISHIFCTFTSQSRAFLSQFSVTGDESVFLCPAAKLLFSIETLFSIISFLQAVKERAIRRRNLQACLGSYAEAPPLLFKERASRRRNLQACLGSYAEAPPLLFKERAIRAKNKELAQFAHELRVDGLGLRVKLANAL